MTYDTASRAWHHPSFKFIEYVPSRVVADEVGVDPGTFFQDITLQAVVDAANQYATGLPHDFIIDRLLVLPDSLNASLSVCFVSSVDENAFDILWA
ncbi:hypothetical protein HZA56_09665 [Candidatus Poribacteria bacterium]|nr:hypothetical protein [Candidatus Poribacteria bacterium]